MKTITTVKDPVCGMDIEAANAPGKTDYKGQAYHFCGAKCKEKFDHDPDHYAGKAGAAAKLG